jgi:F-type H+-transporting ATPase subunit b
MLAQDLFSQLGINPKVLFVQVVAFLVLFFVLNKFLFSKIGKYMEARSEEIKKKFEEMEASKHDFERLKDEYSARLVKIEQEAQLKMQEAVKEGVRMKNDIVTQAQAQAQKEIERARSEILVEKDKAIMEIREKVVDLTLQATEKLIQKTMDEGTHRTLVRKYLDEIEGVKK